MAQLKIFGAIMVALFAIGLETEAGNTRFDLWKIGVTLMNKMSENLSAENQADAEKVFSFARRHISGMEKRYAKAGQELLTAWDAVLHHPDQCNELSFRYVARIAQCYPQDSNSMLTLTEATRNYASTCLTPRYIANKIESEISNSGSGCFSISCSQTKEVKLIDHQLIVDYWSRIPVDGLYATIDGFRASKALAKAVIRDPRRNINGLKERHDVHSYLKEHLYKPCFNYASALKRIMRDLFTVSRSLYGRYEKLISSLDKNTQDIIFRYKLCDEIDSFKMANEISSVVASQLKRLNAS